MTDQQLLIFGVVAGVIGLILIISGLARSRAIKETENNWKSSDTPPVKQEKDSKKAEPSATKEPEKKCIFCGAGMSKDQQFCGSCGRRAD